MNQCSDMKFTFQMKNLKNRYKDTKFRKHAQCLEKQKFLVEKQRREKKQMQFTKCWSIFHTDPFIRVGTITNIDS